MYCATDYGAWCTDSCDWCTQWKDGESTASHDDEMDFSFQSIVTTHLNLLMITFQNIIIQLPLKTMGQHMKHGLR